MEQYSSLLRRRPNYRYLWWGGVVSNLGDWFNLLASAALVARLSDEGILISYLFLARFLPLFLFSPIAGIFADRYSRRKIMILSDLGRGLVVLGFLFVREPSQLWLLFLLTTMQFVLSALFIPARSAVLANVVPADELVTANALDSVTWSTMLAVGSLLGTIAAGLFGIETAFVLDAGTYFLSAWLISRVQNIESTDPEPKPDVVPEEISLKAGLRYLWFAPAILGITLVKAGGSLIWGAINVLEVTFAEQIFPLGKDGTWTLGILYTVSGIGTGFGPLIIRRLLGDEPKRIRQGITLAFICVLVGIGWGAVAGSLLQFTTATLLRTLGSGTLWVFSGALLQLVLPNKVRGRIFSLEFAFLTLTQSLSILWAGYAQDTLGWHVRLILGGMAVVGAIMFGLWLVFNRWMNDLS